MKKLIELKLIEIEAEMEQMKTGHLYFLTNKWMILHGQRLVLGEILKKARK
jgi:hypothetical protein